MQPRTSQTEAMARERQRREAAETKVCLCLDTDYVCAKAYVRACVGKYRCAHMCLSMHLHVVCVSAGVRVCTRVYLHG
jgi:hypothetical protein